MAYRNKVEVNEIIACHSRVFSRLTFLDNRGQMRGKYIVYGRNQLCVNIITDVLREFWKVRVHTGEIDVYENISDMAHGIYKMHHPDHLLIFKFTGILLARHVYNADIVINVSDIHPFPEAQGQLAINIRVTKNRYGEKSQQTTLILGDILELL